MNRWVGRVAVITGAASGIGRAVLLSLAKNGVLVVGLDKNLPKLKELADSVEGVEKSKIFWRQIDVMNEEEIVDAFKWINNELGGVDILVNCAGIARSKKIIESSGENFREIMGINVIATGIAIREAVASMKSREVAGHIINLSSIYGHRVPNTVESPFSVYSPSKFAVTAMTELVRKELDAIDTKIKITNISPGMTKTGIAEAAGHPNHEELWKHIPHLQPENVADAILYVLGTPPNVQVTELTIRAVNEKY